MFIAVQIVIVSLSLSFVDANLGVDLCRRTSDEIDGCLRNGYRSALMRKCYPGGISQSGNTLITGKERRKCLKIEKVAVNMCNFQCSSGYTFIYSAVVETLF